MAPSKGWAEAAANLVIRADALRQRLLADGYTLEAEALELFIQAVAVGDRTLQRDIYETLRPRLDQIAQELEAKEAPGET